MTHRLIIFLQINRICTFGSISPVNKIQKVYLNSTGLVQALEGERLALNCTVTAEWNSRVNINWSYPGKASQTHNNRAGPNVNI